MTATAFAGKPACPFLPTQNYVALVVKPLPPRVSGILLLDQVSRFGEVVATGPECELVEVGDSLIFGSWTTQITVGGKTYLLVAEDNLLARMG